MFSNILVFTIITVKRFLKPTQVGNQRTWQEWGGGVSALWRRHTQEIAGVRGAHPAYSLHIVSKRRKNCFTICCSMVAFFPSCILATHCVLLSVEKEKFGFTRSCSLVACCPSWILATEKVGSTKFYSSCSPTNRPSCTLCGEKRGKFQIRIWERIVL